MRCGTLTSAAEALNVSQPALSQILLHTEDELGFKLFLRVKGRLIPTPEAEELYPEVERLFGDLAELRRRAVDLRQGKSGVVRLAASAPPSLSLVPEALRHFRAAHPDVRILSYVVPAEIIMGMLDRGQAGLGIAMTDQPSPLIDTEIIGHTKVVCVLPAGHRSREPRCRQCRRPRGRDAHLLPCGIAAGTVAARGARARRHFVPAGDGDRRLDHRARLRAAGARHRDRRRTPALAQLPGTRHPPFPAERRSAALSADQFAPTAVAQP